MRDIKELALYQLFHNNLLQLINIFDNCQIAVAVSGGADSMSLAILLQQFCIDHNLSLVALIVDHQLRDNSTQEAQEVSQTLNQCGIVNIVLTIPKGCIGDSQLQQNARRWRYELLKNYCYQHFIPYLCIAHHLDDQLETMLFRESKGSNIIGNSGMSAKVIQSQVTLLRPLLIFNKATLLTFINKAIECKYVNDPSNYNVKFARVKWRQYLATIDDTQQQQLTNRLVVNYQHRILLEQELLSCFKQSININALGLVTVLLEYFLRYKLEVQIIALKRLLQFVSPDSRSIKLKKVTLFLQQLANSSVQKFTLSQALLIKKADVLLIYKNPYYVKDMLITVDPYYLLWDQRFKIPKYYNIQLIQYQSKMLSSTECQQVKQIALQYGFVHAYLNSLCLIKYQNKVLPWSHSFYKELTYIGVPLLDSLFIEVKN